MPFRITPSRDRKLHRLLNRLPDRPLARGEVLYRAGAPAQEVFWVTGGCLILTEGQAKGSRRGRAVEVVGPGELAGDEGLRAGALRETSAVALTPAKVRVVEGRRFLLTLAGSLPSLEAFLAAKAQEISLARFLRPGGRGRGGAQARLAALLLSLAGRGASGRSSPSPLAIPFRLPHRILADLAGLHRSTVTTLVNDWIWRRVLDQRQGSLCLLEPSYFSGLLDAAVVDPSGPTD